MKKGGKDEFVLYHKWWFWLIMLFAFSMLITFINDISGKDKLANLDKQLIELGASQCESNGKLVDLVNTMIDAYNPSIDKLSKVSCQPWTDALSLVRYQS